MCVCVHDVCVSHLSDCVIGADVQGVADSSGQIEGLLQHGASRSFLAPSHRHRPPQVHLDFDETSIHTRGILGKTRGESVLRYCVSNNLRFTLYGQKYVDTFYY